MKALNTGKTVGRKGKKAWVLELRAAQHMIYAHYHRLDVAMSLLFMGLTQRLGDTAKQ